MNDTLWISGHLMQTNGNGVPAGIGGPASAQLGQVRRLGKITWYGSQALIKYVVEARDGRMIEIRTADQCPEIQAWIKAAGRKIRKPMASRGVGYQIEWGAERASVARLVWEYIRDMLGGDGWDDWTEEDIGAAMAAWLTPGMAADEQAKELVEVHSFDPRPLREVARRMQGSGA